MRCDYPEQQGPGPIPRDTADTLTASIVARMPAFMSPKVASMIAGARVRISSSLGRGYLRGDVAEDVASPGGFDHLANECSGVSGHQGIFMEYIKNLRTR